MDRIIIPDGTKGEAYIMINGKCLVGSAQSKSIKNFKKATKRDLEKIDRFLKKQ